MLASQSIFSLTQADFESSRQVSDAQQPPRQPGLSPTATQWYQACSQGKRNLRGRADAFDEDIMASFGDHRTYTRASWLTMTGRVREDLRVIVSTGMERRNIAVFNALVSWVGGEPVASYPPYAQYTLTHLRSDVTHKIAHSLQKSLDNNFNADVLSVLAQTVLPQDARGSQKFQNSPDGVEMKWILASHPDTPQAVLNRFTPADLQWLSVLSHPNTSPTLLINVITSSLYSKQHGGMDSGNLATALAHPWWTTDNLRALCREIAPTLKPALVSHVVDHPACPPEILEEVFPSLGPAATIRLASLSANPETLQQLAYHEDKLVKEAVKNNPRAPIHVQTAAALGNLFR